MISTNFILMHILAVLWLILAQISGGTYLSLIAPVCCFIIIIAAFIVEKDL